MTLPVLPWITSAASPPASRSWKGRCCECWTAVGWRDDRVQHALHWDGYGKEHKSEGKVTSVPGVMEGWHTFALWWKADEYIFDVDGKETRRTLAGGVCQVPLYIKLSDEIGEWGGDIKKATLPDQFLVDYVRVYDLADAK